ncbi:protein BCAP isoform X5 [Petaurus breviceps papuanus]|uniref:protein BCAP isoform X5 n=1 Tax=Petaurus breviceps papuanus TaxID=3040969 RepID=UPI0036DBBFFC
MEKPEKQESHSEELSSHHPSKQQENNQPWSTSENEVNWLKQDILNEQTELERKLQETEIAANSVVALIPLFKDFLAGFNSESVSSSIDILKARLADNEHENNVLKKKVLEKEDYIQELSSFIQKEKNLKSEIAEWKLQLKTYEQQVVTLKQTNEQKKIALKKASKVCKERADSFTANIEDLTSQIRDREAKLSEALSASLAWKSHYEKAVEEKTDLEVQIETLKKKIINLLEDQHKKEDPGRNTNENFLRKLHSSDSENESILLENEKLKMTLADLEEKVISVENERLELQEVEKKQKALVEVYTSQVQKLQKAVEDVKSRHQKLVSEKNLITQNKKSALEEIDDNQSLLKTFSLEEENNSKLKCDNLKHKLEQMGAENEKLERKAASQEEYLKKNKFKFKEKSAEYNALARQLEVALEEGRQKVSEEIEKMTSREQALQTKILDLESELRKKNEEQNQLVCILSTKEQHQEICLKEIQHRLEKTENQNESIQNYVQFVKNSYVTMFG